MTRREQAVVFGCVRADLARRPLPSGARLVELPCSGRVSATLLLAALARGADGVLVVGRHQHTCRFEGAEDPARARVGAVQRLLPLLGLHAERVSFVEPAPGAEGPPAAVARFIERLDVLGPSPIGASAPPAELLHDEGLDGALELARWLAVQPAEEVTQLDSWLAARGLKAASPGEPRLLVGCLPQLSELGGELFRPLDLPALIGVACAVLDRLGVAAGVAASGDEDVTALDDFLRQRAGELPPPPRAARIACDGSVDQRTLIAALGHEAVDVGSDPLLGGARIVPKLSARRRAVARLQRAASAGAEALLVGSHETLVRWALVTRQGSWQSALVQPLLGVELAQLSLLGAPLGARPAPAWCGAGR